MQLESGTISWNTPLCLIPFRLTEMEFDDTQMSPTVDEPAAETATLAELSHDLRTPLNVIVGYLDMLLDGAFGPLQSEQIDTLERIRSCSVDLTDPIQRLTDALAPAT